MRCGICLLLDKVIIIPLSYQIKIQMIGLYLSDYTFSSTLPDSFNITGVSREFVEVNVSLEGQSIYSTKLYKNSNNTCTFYELRQIVEQNMVARGLPWLRF